MKYKVGDRVRIKSLDWYNENKDKNGNIVFSSKVPHFALCVNVRTVFTKDMVKYCGKVVTIENVWTVNYSIGEGAYRYYFTDEMIEGLANPIEIDAKTFSEGYDQGYEDAFNDIVSYLRNHLYTPEFKDKNRFSPCVVSAENISLDELIDNLQEYIFKE